jgi:hypothetical protein
MTLTEILKKLCLAEITPEEAEQTIVRLYGGEPQTPPDPSVVGSATTGGVLH